MLLINRGEFGSPRMCLKSNRANAESLCGYAEPADRRFKAIGEYI